MIFTPPARRDVVLYVRIKEKNKKLVESLAGKHDASEAFIIDSILDDYASNNSEPKKRTRKNK